MALPAGRRGIRANLVKSDGTIRDLTKLKEDFAALSASDIPTIDVPLFKSLTGNPVTISDAAGENVKCAKATLEPIQSGSGTPSPTNVRPISGRTQVDVNRTGKNLLNQTIYNIAVTGSNITSNENYRSMWCKVLGGQTYTISRNEVSGNRFRVYATKTEPAVGVQADNIFNDDTSLKQSFTVPIGYNYLFVYLANDGSEITSNIQIELGSTATEYEPYAGQSVTVQLGQTVYGGTLNVTTGLLTVETANIASYNGESIGEPWWSSMDEYVAGTTPTTGAQVVYTLASPVTVSLTPAQIQLLTTTNIISTNADALSILYRAAEEGSVEGALQYLFDKIEELSAQINE